MTSESKWPGIEQAFSRGILPQVTETDESSGETYIKLGAMVFSVGLWMFEHGALLGYGLRDYPELLTKLLGVRPRHTDEFTQSYLKEIAATLIEADDIEETRTFGDLFYLPTLKIAGYEVEPNAEWMALQLTDRDWTWNFAQKSFRQGVGIALHYRDILVRCWNNAWNPGLPDNWEELQQYGVLEIFQQDNRILEEEVAKVLTAAVDWVDRTVGYYFSEEEITILNNLAEPEA